ncbi:hypothetical protein J2Z62_000386 [Mycoplasmoides fastidiosum]|uniref:Uncharacterized protein n=1 Tax=Mycoplasmoides fastidiosum TaxID=92758 RepID=A0ABU0LZ31_9BACT|nr:hypothetical protein [Mycoplasmoides fastidiosum]MDQ0513948.1 hypothetical protein [Mycoplasmoides fastidiosum]UUD37638.1 hypothetical protein NPA10_03665 [Mycoplasmoides fastidiosum]
MILKNRIFFSFRFRKRNDNKSLENNKIMQRIQELENEKKLNRYDIRILKQKAKILSARNVKAKVFEEPKNTRVQNHLNVKKDEEEFNKFTKVFEESGFIDGSIDKIRQQEQEKLLNDPKVFRIKWADND